MNLSYINSLIFISSIVFLGRIYNRYWLNRIVYRSNRSLKGKTSIITGSTSGLGFQLAKEFLKRGCRVVMASRNSIKGQLCLEQIISQCQVDRSKISFIHCDLSSFKSIEQFVQRFERENDRLDLLICNGGLGQSSKISSEDSFDNLIQTNYLGHSYLIKLLQEKLEFSRPSRIINVSSDLHQMIRSTDKKQIEDTILSRVKIGNVYRYGYSKLFQILENVEKKEFLLDRGINMLTVTPGWVSTSIEDPFEQIFPQYFREIYRIFIKILRFFFSKTLEKGCETILFCSIDPSLEYSKDIYFQNCRVIRPSNLSQNIDLARFLSNLTSKIFDSRKDLIKE